MFHSASTIPLGTPPPEQLRLLGRRVTHPPGARLLTAGDRPTAVLLLKEGLVKSVLPHYDGRQTILAVRPAGTVLGSTAALTRTPHPASVVALRTCVAYHLGVVTLRQLVDRDLQTWLGWVLEEHARLIVEGDKKQAAFHRQTAGTRLVLQLLDWAAQFGTPGDGGGVNVTGLTRLELAEAIGVNPKHVDEVLGRLCRAGLLVTGRRLFHIPDPDMLADAAHDAGHPNVRNVHVD